VGDARSRGRWLTALVALALLHGCAARGGDTGGPQAAADADPDAIMAAAVQAWQVPGAALVIMKRDEVVLARGYGLESAERPDAVAPTTSFALGSLSAQFTAALILKLAEERRLSIDDPVARHLPDFTRLPAGLRIRHLLTHTSGMRDFFLQPELDAVFQRPEATLQDVVAVVRHSPADFMPGTRWAYANINYVMLQVIAERVTRQVLEDAVENRIVAPLGLLTLKPCPPQPGGARGMARGHEVRGGALAGPPPENFHLFRGAAGYCGSAVDVALWTRALATGKVVNAASLAQMTAPVALAGERAADYGFAMALVSPDGLRRFGHGGFGGGFSLQAAYYPDAELTVVVMLNRFAFPEQLERRIVHAMLDLPPPAAREVALASPQRQNYVGSYDIGVPGRHAGVVEREGKLWFEMAPQPPQPLSYLGKGEFVQEGQPYGYRLYFDSLSPPAEVRILGVGLMNWYGVRRK